MSPRRRLLLAGLVLLIVATGVWVGIRLVPDNAPAGRPAQDQPGPVLLVPGYGGSRDSLTALAGHIRATGRDARVISLPGDGTGDLLAQVAALDREIGDTPSVDLVGYSAGGVVVRLWVAKKAGEHRARRVVTLGSPLHGTRLAASGGAVAPDACPLACQQLAPGSVLLASLEGQPVPVPWLSIWTENDQTVIPPESAHLDGAENLALQHVCPNVHIEHSELPTHEVVTQLVLRALSEKPLPPQTDGLRCP